jgi:nicotine blue oxidoreductase
MTLAGIVLAAGRSGRTTFPKALALLDGEPLAMRAVRTLREGGCEAIVVVVGPPHEAAVAACVDVPTVRNDAPERGMLRSLQLGARAVMPCDALVFSLVDHPRVRPETVARLIERFRAGAVAVRPRKDGRTGHPALMSREVLELVLQGSEDESARDIVGERWTDLEVDDPGILDDLDSDEALAALGIVRPVA